MINNEKASDNDAATIHFNFYHNKDISRLPLISLATEEKGNLTVTPNIIKPKLLNTKSLKTKIIHLLIIIQSAADCIV